MEDHANLKSQVRFAKSLFKALLTDISTGRPPHIRSSLQRDLLTITTRLDNEGISFVTITLPTLAKAMYSSFKTGYITTPSNFAKRRGTALPRFLFGLLKDVYEEDGMLAVDPSVPSIKEALQICGLAYKLNIPINEDDKRYKNVIDNFKSTENYLSKLKIDHITCTNCFELARTMIEDVFAGINPWNILPRHGPGTVATGEWAAEKWVFGRKYSSIHSTYPYYEYFVLGKGKEILDRKDWYLGLKPEVSGTATVVLVPKDSRGPRIISKEPLEYQYIQQGLWRLMRHEFQTHPFTRGHVNFDDQTINQKLARKGSLNGSWATLDMKDASDRVSLDLVKQLFSTTPDFLECLLACRSTSTKLPSGEVIDLHKFAPMGSATCFPIESIVHYVLAVASIMVMSNLSRWKARSLVYVYGDDLIIHSRHADSVLAILPLFGLMFNEQKCYTHGPFRESCGVESFLGNDISPIRWRKPCPQRLDAVTASSFADFASSLYQQGYLAAAEVVWSRLETYTGKLPVVPLSWNVPYLSRKTRFRRFFTPYRHRWNKKLHHHEHLGLCLSQVRSKDPNVPQWALLLKKCLTGDGTSRELTVFSSLKKRWMRIQ
jgi:hypothetical protein